MPERALSRVDWVDIVKGAAVVLVVLHHAVALTLQNRLADPSWYEITVSLRAFRMPLFFFASGLFAGSVVRRSWSRLWSTRLALLVSMFVLWSVLRFTFFVLVPMRGQSDESSVTNLLLSPVRPMSALWFLQALIVFFVVAKLSARVPAWLQLFAGAALSVLFFAGFSLGNMGYDGMARLAVFFLLGLHLKSGVLERMTVPRPIAAICASTAFVVGAVWVLENDFVDVPGVMPALGLLGVSGGILMARLLDASAFARPLARALAHTGRNTLPVYVTHVILVAAGIAGLQALGLQPTAGGMVVLPLLLALGATALSLLLARLVRGTPLRFLYEVPTIRRKARVEPEPAAQASALT